MKQQMKTRSIPMPEDFSEWSVEKQQGFFKGYRYAMKIRRNERKKKVLQQTKEDTGTIDEMYPYNLLIHVCQMKSIDINKAYSVSIQSFHDYCKHHLKDNERNILKLRYQDHLTQKECGYELGISSSRVGQIEQKAYRKISADFNQRHDLETVSVSSVEKEHHDYLKAKRILKEYGDRNSNLNDEIFESLKIEDMNFSVRTFNCLIRAGIYDAEDLTEKTESDLKKIRNCSTKTITEIRNRLAEWNLSLKEDKS